MADVAMIYSAADAGVARAVAAALSSEGLSVDLAGAGAQAAEPIAQAKAVVVVWSRAGADDAAVLDAAGAAFDLGRLAPVRIDDAQPPLGFRQLQTADLSTFPAAESGPALHALAQALIRLRDGRLSRMTPRALERFLGIRRFLLSGNFWLGGLALGVLLGAGAALSAAAQDAQSPLAERIAALIAPVLLLTALMLAGRAILHASRRLIGLQTAAFFSLEYLATLALGLAIAAGVAAAGGMLDPAALTEGVALGPDLGLRLVAALSIGGLAAALLIFILRLVRRLALGPVRGRVL